MEIHERVKIARVFAGLSTGQLAKRLGLARTNIIRWESEAGLTLPPKQIQRLAESTGVPAYFLKEGKMEGLVVARPGRFVSKNVLGRTYEYIDSILPLLTNNDSTTCITLITPERHYATILHNENDKLCLVIIPADQRRPFTRNTARAETIEISADLLAAAYKNDAGIDELLQIAGIVGYSTSNKSATITLSISGGDKLRTIGKVLTFVDELRKDGCDVDIQICDRISGAAN